MSRDRMLDLLGLVSPIGLLLCFGGAIWADAIGNDKLKHIVEITSAVSLSIIVFTFAAYLWEIARK